MTSKEVQRSLRLGAADLPAVFMGSNSAGGDTDGGGGGMLRYSGEILELNLSEWVLRNSSPSMGELSITSSAGTVYW